MYFVRLFFLSTLILFIFRGNAEKLLLEKNAYCKIWWAGSTYKIMQDDPVPENKEKVVIRSAKNETESFQLVLTPSRELKDISVNTSDFRKKDGEVISSENITIRNVEYVHVIKPTGKLHKAGWYPDPLPLHEKPFDAAAGQNSPVWFTIKVPEGAAAEKYIASIRLKSANWEAVIPVELIMWYFTLPEVPFMRSGLNLKSKLIEQYHNLDSEKELKYVTEKGKQFWSYLMCWPKNPHVNPFIDSHAINMRMWLWISYKYNLKGIVVWQSNQWHRSGGTAPDDVLQNIWEDPMTYKSGYGTPYGSAPEFGHGDGMFFYPTNRDPNNDKTKYLTGPVPSMRLEILREGLDDYDYMMMLENCIKEAKPGQKNLVKKAEKILGLGSELLVNDTEYNKDPEILMT